MESLHANAVYIASLPLLRFLQAFKDFKFVQLAVDLIDGFDQV